MKFNIIIINLFFLIYIIYCQDSKIVECPDGKTKCNSDNGKCRVFDDDPNLYFCECFRGYTNDPDKNEIGCTYKQKRQLKAFLFELFLCYGAGHFYIHNYKLAIPKLVVFAFFYCLFIALRIITKAKEENRLANLIICISAGISFVGMLIWQIIDLINFGKNKYKDGNNIPLVEW